MRRFSQRNSLVTLSDINITPLLDLAFVLLIIFVITTPLLTQSLNLKLPGGGQAENKPRNPKDIRTVEISRDGVFRLDKKTLSPDQIEAELVRVARVNPNLIVDLRADENGAFKHAATIISRCLKNNITKVSIRTETPKRR
jgi:biopolymer transport protein ExbD